MLERLPLLSAGISLRPLLACEISPAGVLAARPDGDILVTHFVALPPGCLAPGTKPPTILDRPKVVAAVRTAVSAVAERGRNLPGGRSLPANRALTAIVPDASVRVLLLDFDTLPSKRVEILSILRFRLRKLVPFEVEDAVISYQTAGASADQTRLLVTVVPRDVLVEYEGVVREAGYYAGVVLPSTLAATTLLGSEPALVVNRNGNTLTTAIVRGEELLLHRALEFELDQDTDHSETPSNDIRTSFLPSRQRTPLEQALAMEAHRADDIRQTVSVAMAYYEDTLAAVPTALYYIGPGTVEEFEALLGEGLLAPRAPEETQMLVRELLPASGTESLSVPRALLAPVAGALRNG
jgi:type IV pilus assembly protein PilM